MFAVTEEEDDLWSTLPDSVLANQNQQIQSLHRRLTTMREKAEALNTEGEQLVFVSSYFLYTYLISCIFYFHW